MSTQFMSFSPQAFGDLLEFCCHEPSPPGLLVLTDQRLAVRKDKRPNDSQQKISSSREQRTVVPLEARNSASALIHLRFASCWCWCCGSSLRDAPNRDCPPFAVSTSPHVCLSATPAPHSRDLRVFRVIYGLPARDHHRPVNGMATCDEIKPSSL